MEVPEFRAAPPHGVYRPDIDGLRAVAVLAIILFHLDRSLLPGGFVGVDVFFVISGYLITLHILNDLRTGRFSIAEFYRRRVKRIAPALWVVLAATLAATQFLLRPEDARRTADSAAWSLLSLANVYFWLYQDKSYFAPASNQTPLLHLWSLGVEEQFYLVWPILLAALYRPRRARSFLVVAAAGALLSFGLAEQLYEQMPSFVYYMLPTRAGELLIGALSASIVLGGVAISDRLAWLLSLAGAVLVACSLALLHEGQVFPGWLAVPPTLGTALLILAGRSSRPLPIRLLRLPPLVWVGLVSYSAYLWHWPLLALFHYGHARVGLAAGCTIFGLTFLLAWPTYRLIEQPARRSRATAGQVFLRQYVVPAGMLGALAALCIHLDGFGLRWYARDYRQRLAALRELAEPAYSSDSVCQRLHVTRREIEEPKCVVGADTAASPKAILWGDSNAAHYVGMIEVFARAGGFRFRNIEVGSCPPLLDDPSAFVSSDRAADCRAFSELARSVVTAFPVVLVSSSWSAYQQQSSRFLPAFFETAARLARDGRKVVILAKIPILEGYDGLCREKAISYPGLHCPLVAARPGGEVAEINARLQDFAEATPGVEYFDPTPYLCPQGVCSAYLPDLRPLYYDSSHLTLSGSRLLGDRILEQIGVPQPFAQIGGSRSAGN